MTDNDSSKQNQPTGETTTQKVGALADKASDTVETAKSAFSAIKWAAIAFVFGLISFVGFKTYKLVSAPAVAVGNAVEGATDAVKSGATAVKETSSEVMNRLDIAVTDTEALNQTAEAAFTSLAKMGVTKPDGVKDKLFRSTKLGGNDGKVCQLSQNFGDGPLQVYVAADNEAHTTAKALGSTEDRLIRAVIMVADDDLGLNALWNEDAQSWTLKWRRTTVKKPISDPVAEARMLDVLSAAATDCT